MPLKRTLTLSLKSESIPQFFPATSLIVLGSPRKFGRNILLEFEISLAILVRKSPEPTLTPLVLPVTLGFFALALTTPVLEGISPRETAPIKLGPKKDERGLVPVLATVIVVGTGTSSVSPVRNKQISRR